MGRKLLAGGLELKNAKNPNLAQVSKTLFFFKFTPQIFFICFAMLLNSHQIFLLHFPLSEFYAIDEVNF